ncbi:MAG: hypothetical protein U1E97_03035 [Alphaproteobacteria bacterium]
MHAEGHEPSHKVIDHPAAEGAGVTMYLPERDRRR